MHVETPSLDPARPRAGRPVPELRRTAARGAPRAAAGCSPTWPCTRPAWTAGWPPACCGRTSRTAGPPATCARRCGGCSRSAARWWPPSSPGWACATTSRSTCPAGGVGHPRAGAHARPRRPRRRSRSDRRPRAAPRLVRRLGPDRPRAAAAAPAARAGGAEPAAPPGGPAGRRRRGDARGGARRAAARERSARAHRGAPGGRRLDRRPAAVRRVPQHPAPRDRRGTECGADRRRPGPGARPGPA